jgi:6-pyruvoyltetrahydropterin/6-carboxytetrahydropterin synthase
MMPQIAVDCVPSELDGLRVETSIQCVRRVQFCAGHRVWKHESKCAHLHGHNYVAYFYATANALDGLGRIIDFSELKARLGGWIDEYWDHGFILNRHDQAAIDAVQSIPEQKLYLLDDNPTAENMAEHLLTMVAHRQMAGSGVRVVKVVLCETENCYAEVVS